MFLLVEVSLCRASEHFAPNLDKRQHSLMATFGGEMRVSRRATIYKPLEKSLEYHCSFALLSCSTKSGHEAQSDASRHNLLPVTQHEICRNSWQFGPTYASRARRHIILHRPFPSRDGCSGPQ